MKKQLRKVVLSLFATLLLAGANAQITVFPYTEDFESFATCGTGCGASCTLTNNWVNDTGDNLDWLTDAGGTSSSNTGPSADHTTGTTTGNYLYVETSCSGTGFPNYQANLLSPSIDLTGTNDVQFEFWYHMYGQSMGTLHIDVSSDGGTSWTNDVVPAWTDDIDLWQQSPSISLGAWVGSTVIVRLRFISGTNFYSDVAVDDFTIYDLLAEDAGITQFIQPQLPTCSFNDSVTVELTNFGTDTLTSVTIDWAFNGTGQTTYNWTGSLPYGATENVFLGTAPYTSGDNLMAYTSLPNGITEFASGNGNDTSYIDISTGLNGTYTIGATGDYLTFNAAVTDLNTYGVCGAVIFNVEDGTYNEQVVLQEVIGMSSSNTVTFQSLNADPSLVTLTYAAAGSTDNFVVQMQGGDFYNFNNLGITSGGLTYGTAIDVTGEACHNSWTGNIISGPSTVSTTSTNMALITSYSGSSDTSNVFDNNTMNYGSYVFYWYGTSGNNETGLVFTNNTLDNFYYRGLHLYYLDDVEIGGNVLTPLPNYTGSIYRVYLHDVTNGAEIYNNDLRGMSYGYGMYLSSLFGTLSTPVNVYNNFVHLGDTTTTSTSYGLYITGCNYVNMLNNSINIESIGTASRGVYVTGGTQNTLMNNIVSNEGPGYAIYYISGLGDCNHNDYYAPNGIPFYFNGDVTDINTWQSSTGFDMVSDTLDPMFHASDDLHTCQSQFIDAGATHYAFITDDIDGQVRDTVTPDIGADEFLGLNIGFESDTIYKCTTEVLILGGWEPQDDAISYLWNTTESTPSVGVTGGGNYNCTVTTACGTAYPSVEVALIPDAVAGFDLFTSFLTAQCTSTSSGTITSYLWDFGDGTTSSEMSPTHLYADTGMYTITLTVSGPCGSDTYTQDMYANTVGIEDLEVFGALNVYPNPNSGTFTIDMSTSEGTSVAFKLTDVKGSVVWSAEPGVVEGNFKQQVTLNNQAEGVYFLTITAGEHSTVRKVILN